MGENGTVTHLHRGHVTEHPDEKSEENQGQLHLGQNRPEGEKLKTLPAARARGEGRKLLRFEITRKSGTHE